MGSQKELRVECPACDERLAVDLRTGRVIAHQPPRRTDAAGRPKLTEGDWDAAVERVAGKRGSGEDALERALAREKGAENRLDELFGQVRSRVAAPGDVAEGGTGGLPGGRPDVTEDDGEIEAGGRGGPRWGSAEWICLLDAVERRMLTRRTELRAGLPGNPRGAAVERFGELVLLRSDRWNALLGASSRSLADLERALVQLAATRGERFVQVLPEAGGGEGRVFEALAAAGWGLGTYDALFAKSLEIASPSTARPAGVRVRAAAPAEFAAVLQAGCADAAERPADFCPEQDRARLTAEFSAPEFRLLVVEVDGRAAGAAAAWIEDSVASLCMAAVLPEYRGRGLQRALIAERLELAASAGCTTAISSPRLMSASESSHRRAGFELAFPIYRFEPPDSVQSSSPPASDS